LTKKTKIAVLALGYVASHSKPISDEEEM